MDTPTNLPEVTAERVKKAWVEPKLYSHDVAETLGGVFRYSSENLALNTYKAY
jgi:hypothetical protein